MDAGRRLPSLFPIIERYFPLMGSLFDRSTYISFLFRLQISNTRTKSNQIVTQHKIRLISPYTESHRILHFHILFFRSSIHLLEKITRYRIPASISSRSCKIVLAAKSSPIGNWFQPPFSFTGSHSGHSSQIHRSDNLPVLIPFTLKKSESVVGINIKLIRKITGTLQTITTTGCHINHHIIIRSTFYQIVIVIKPACTVITTCRIPFHTDIILSRFFNKLFQFPKFTIRKRSRPSLNRRFQHLIIRNMSRFSFVIHHRITVQTGRNIPFIMIEGTASIEIEQCFHILPCQALPPRSIPEYP